MVGNGKEWRCKSVGEIEPNTKVFMEQFAYTDLNDLTETCVQLFAYKADKPFERKRALDTRIRIDATKFYKLNTFRENDFFDSPALLYAITEKAKVEETHIEPKLELPKKLQGTQLTKMWHHSPSQPENHWNVGTKTTKVRQNIPNKFLKTIKLL